MPRRDTIAKRMGRPTRLTPDVADRIVRAVRAGNHLATACALARIPSPTFYRWMDYAERVDYAITSGQPYDPEHLRFRDFRDAVQEARAHAAESMIDIVQRAARGGDLIEEKPALDGSGNPIRDDDGAVIMERRWTQPDGRLALSYLKVAQPAEWGGGASRLEVSGPGGSPIQTQEVTGDDVTRLSVRVTAAIAERRAIEAARHAEEHGYDLDDAPEDTVDADIVEET